jgi:hypothetical protein
MAGLTEFYCGWNEPSHDSQFKWLEYTFKEPRKRFQGIDSVSLCSLAGRTSNRGSYRPTRLGNDSWAPLKEKGLQFGLWRAGTTNKVIVPARQANRLAE